MGWLNLIKTSSWSFAVSTATTTWLWPIMRWIDQSCDFLGNPVRKRSHIVMRSPLYKTRFQSNGLQGLRHLRHFLHMHRQSVFLHLCVFAPCKIGCKLLHTQIYTAHIASFTWLYEKFYHISSLGSTPKANIQRGNDLHAWWIFHVATAKTIEKNIINNWSLILPSGKQTQLLKIAIYSEFSH